MRSPILTFPRLKAQVRKNQWHPLRDTTFLRVTIALPVCNMFEKNSADNPKTTVEKPSVQQLGSTGAGKLQSRLSRVMRRMPLAAFAAGHVW
eukprot:s3590_g10.t1